MDLAGGICEQGSQSTLMQGREDDAGNGQTEYDALDKCFQFRRAGPFCKGRDQLSNLY